MKNYKVASFGVLTGFVILVFTLVGITASVEQNSMVIPPLLQASVRQPDGWSYSGYRNNIFQPTVTYGTFNGITKDIPPPLDTTYTLPVVVHIIADAPSAIPDITIINAIQDLNDAFGKAGAYSASKGVDTKIRFCLAQKDPDGGNTTGITRTEHFFADNLNPAIEDDKIKGLIQWDSQRYINIWYIATVNEEISATFSCGKWGRQSEGGYPTLPPNAGALDGIVLLSFGNPLIQNMGRYLGLYYTFQGGCTNNNCSVDGDQVCDTPPEAYPSGGNHPCGIPVNTCSSDTLSGFKTDMPDPTANFMDAGNYACHNAFTEGQAKKMRTCITTQRAGLLQNECDKPCANSFVAAFTRNNAYPLPGDQILFTNTSGGGATNYQWLVNGVVVSTSQNFSYSFSDTGKFKVTLKAFGSDPTCFAAYTDYVKVTCGVTARFYSDKQHIASTAPIYLDSIVFTNTSVGATSFEWLMANDSGMTEQVVSTQKNLTYIFKQPANYTVRLIAINGSCTDTTEIYNIAVDNATADGVAYMSTVDCYQQTKIRVGLYICNNGYAPIPAGTPISFYDADPRLGKAHKLSPSFIMPDTLLGKCCSFTYVQILDVGKRGLNQLFMVFNDNGTTMPLKLPNTSLKELNYANNIQSAAGFQFKVSINPDTPVLQPGDTVKLVASTTPNAATSYLWNPAGNLSCSNCSSPNLIADTNQISTKRVIAKSIYACIDTAYAIIKVPPYNDFTLTLDDVQCAADSNVRISFTIVDSFKRGVIPSGLSVAFYNANPSTGNATLLPPLFFVQDSVKAKTASFSTLVKNINLGSTIYAVVNDNGTTSPLSLPNTYYPESDYTNNIASAAYVPLKASAGPALSVMAPGDTLQIYASGTPGPITSYLWAPPLNINCPTCDSTFLIADSSRMKQVTVANAYGCTDTASITIQVPPYNDFTVAVNDIECAGTDSLYVNFTISNSFKRGVIPQSLTVAWYNGNPTANGASLLPPLFSVLDTVKLKQATFSTFIKATSPGNVYAVVNDSGTTSPLQLPNVVHLPEKDYTNNVTSYNYQPATVLLQPADTTVLRKTSFTYSILSPVVDPASTVWDSGANYTLSCYNCVAPTATVFNVDTVIMHTANKYGCMIEGQAVVKIIAPDITIQLLHTDCYTDDSTLAFFKICMNNNYDTVFANLPVAFYDADPSQGGANLLSPVFYTKQATAGGCDTFFCIVTTPFTHHLYASVNDKGQPGNPIRVFDETDYTNNTDTVTTIPFTAAIVPADTSIAYGQSVVLNIQANAGIASVLWQPADFLSCTACIATTVTPQYSTNYSNIIRNRYFCIDTAYAVVKIYRGTDVSIPSAFTPNGDGRNDVFYVFGGQDAALIKNFAIYNRWGNKVFNVSNVLPNTPLYGWNGNVNGNAAASGTYVYMVTMQFADGSEKNYKGTVVLVR
jgi:gliding motility-associated-like protein